MQKKSKGMILSSKGSKHGLWETTDKRETGSNKRITKNESPFLPGGKNLLLFCIISGEGTSLTSYNSHRIQHYFMVALIYEYAHICKK